MKWSTKSGHRVKAVKCHNEVKDDNRDEKAKELKYAGAPGDSKL